MKQPTIHYVLLSVLLATFAQKALAQKTETSTPVNLTEFAMPPFPVEVVRLEVQAGQLSLLTRMPIAGRPLPISETPGVDSPKPRGAAFDPSAVYVCQQTLNTQGQPIAPVRSKVFAQALPSASPADFAVFGTQAANGPMRLPLGRTPREMIRDYPQLAQTEPTIQNVWLVSRGQGQNFATYRLSPRFRVVTRETDPQSGQVRSRADEQAPQREATEAKTGAYLAVAGSTPEESGRVIALSPTATSPSRYEGLATRFVEGDKNASARQVNLLTFAADGTLLRDQPVPFAYNRQLSMRIPVCDEAGHVVGSLSVFTDGPGKKDARDPQENRFSVVITDEQGGIWSQIELTTGGSSPRSLVPIYALRQQNRLLLHSLNGQKLLKPVYESWAITRSGPDNQAQTTLLSSMSEGELYDRSKAEGSVNGGERIGWHFYNGTHPVDSFVGNDGSIWVLQQRHKPGPQPVNFGTTPIPPNDLFVLHFDKNLTLLHQTVVALGLPAGESVRLKHSRRATGTDYVLLDGPYRWLRLRDSSLELKPLVPKGMVAEKQHIVFDESAGLLHVLTQLAQQRGQAQLTTYGLE